MEQATWPERIVKALVPLPASAWIISVVPGARQRRRIRGAFLCLGELTYGAAFPEQEMFSLSLTLLPEFTEDGEEPNGRVRSTGGDGGETEKKLNVIMWPKWDYGRDGYNECEINLVWCGDSGGKPSPSLHVGGGGGEASEAVYDKPRNHQWTAKSWQETNWTRAAWKTYSAYISDESPKPDIES